LSSKVSFYLNKNITLDLICYFYEISISKIVEDYGSKVQKVNENASKFWDLIEKRLSSLMRKAAEIACNQGLIKEIVKHKYFVSSKYFT